MYSLFLMISLFFCAPSTVLPQEQSAPHQTTNKNDEATLKFFELRDKVQHFTHCARWSISPQASLGLLQNGERMGKHNLVKIKNFIIQLDALKEKISNHLDVEKKELEDRLQWALTYEKEYLRSARSLIAKHTEPESC